MKDTPETEFPTAIGQAFQTNEVVRDDADHGQINNKNVSLIEAENDISGSKIIA